MSWARASDGFSFAPASLGHSLRPPSRGSSRPRSSLAAAANGCLSARGSSNHGQTTRLSMADGFIQAAEGFSTRTPRMSASCQGRAERRELAAICALIGQEAALKTRSSRDAFRFVDPERGGSITRAEVRCFFHVHGVSERDADRFFSCLDGDSTGQIDYREFLDVVRPYVQIDEGCKPARSVSRQSEASTRASDLDCGAAPTREGTPEAPTPIPSGRARTWPVSGARGAAAAPDDVRRIVDFIGEKVACKYTTFRDFFRALDVDKDGTVGQQDLRTFFSQCSLPKKSADALFASMDRDGSGEVEYIEFMAMFGPSIQPGYSQISDRSAEKLRRAERPPIWRVS